MVWGFISGLGGRGLGASLAHSDVLLAGGGRGVGGSRKGFSSSFGSKTEGFLPGFSQELIATLGVAFRAKSSGF